MEYILTDKAPQAIGPYSQGIEANGFVYLSGQIPLVPATGEVCEGEILEQTTQVCENIKAILNDIGLNFQNVVKTTCFLQDMSDFADFNKIYALYFTSKPARSCVAVKTLPKNVLCEIEIIAVR